MNRFPSFNFQKVIACYLTSPLTRMKKNCKIHSHEQAHSFAQLKDRALSGARLSRDKHKDKENDKESRRKDAKV